MAEGFVCDRCGAAIFPGENTKFALEMRGPDKQAIETDAALDFCPKCARAVAGIIRKRIVTTDTRHGAFQDTEEVTHAGRVPDEDDD